MSSATQALTESLRLLWTRRFGSFWGATLLGNIGTWAQQVAEPWLLLSLGASSFLVGLDSFAMNAPVWVLTLVGGVLADRGDRRRIIALFQAIQMLCPVAIVIMLLTHTITAWPIIVAAFVVGVTDALSMPSFQSIVPSIVEREQIPRGLALNSIQFNLSRILGPAIAGVLLSSVGAVGCFVVSAASYVPYIGIAFWVLPRSEPRPDEPRARPRDVLSGLRAVTKESRHLWALLSVLTTGLFCAPLLTFTPVLVKAAFQGDAARFSIAVASFGVGGLLGAAAMLAVPLAYDRRRLSSVCAAVHGVVLVLAARTPWFWALPPLLLVAGAVMTASNTSANAIIQATASKRLLGQTVSMFMLAMRGGMALGALLMGLSVSLLGVRHALMINGLVALVVQLVVGHYWTRVTAPSPAP